jgi:hypothetical protein
LHDPVDRYVLGRDDVTHRVLHVTRLLLSRRGART